MIMIMRAAVLLAAMLTPALVMAAEPVELLTEGAGAKGNASEKAAGWTPADCIDGACDRAVPVYGVGEEMAFTFRLRGFAGLDRSKCRFDWMRTGDDGKKESGTAPAAEPLVLVTSLDRPGFVRYYVELKDVNGETVRRASGTREVFFDGGAGVDIFSIRQAVPEPADFDAFWTKHKASLAKVTWRGQEKLEKVESSNPKVDVYKVSVPCAGGMPMTGFLYVPVAAKDGRKFPAEISFSGYGASWRATHPLPERQKGEALVFACSAHGFDLMREPEYYSALRKKVSVNGHGYAFDLQTNADPETAYFCGMTYRVMRALEFLKSRPEWDGRTLTAHGGSMGGLQTIWAAALDADVTAARADIPWCCDIGGTEVGRNRGDWYVKWVPALGYYDPVNMAKRIPAKTRFEIPRFGLGDYTCPPTGVMAMYNNLRCVDRRALGFQNSTHGYVVPRPRQMLAIAGGALADATPWVAAEEKKGLRRRAYEIEFIAGSPETDAVRFWLDKAKGRSVDINYDETKAGELGKDYELPELMAFADGRKVKTAADWAERRKEILGIFERELYGVMPPKPEALEVELLSDELSEDRFSRRRTYRTWFRKDRTGPCIDWFAMVPVHAKGRVPVVVHLNYKGNDVIAKGKTNHHKLPLEEMAARGYALLSAWYKQVTADPKTDEEFGHVYDGVYELWGCRDPKRTDNTGTLMAWAWAMLRGLDLAERIPEIDAKRNVLIGSSRLGKAALLAGAYDERVAVTVPNQTGAVGVQVMRRNYGETLEAQKLMFPHWYCSAAWKYVGCPEKQPFDQHMLLACVAPRALLLECYHKRWFDPKGEFIAAQAASPAWELLTGRGLACGKTMPEPYDDAAVRPPFGYVRRTECHGLSPYDWKWALDFADEALRTNPSNPSVVECDLVIYGSSPAAISAAVQAKRMGKRAIIVSPETRIGGLTTGGLGQTDIGNKKAIGGIALEFYRAVADYYRDESNWKWQKRSDYLPDGQCAGTKGADSMWTFEPSAALKILEGWEKRDELEIHRGKRLDRSTGSVKIGSQGNERKIVSFVTEDGTEYRGKMFVDATYEGDLMAAAGVSYTIGREANSVYLETINGNAPDVQGAWNHNYNFPN